MTMYDTADKLREESKDLFKGGLSFRQLWWIVKLCKAVRLYCRSNVALNNFFNSVFRGTAGFRQVPKQDSQGKEYTGLEIKMTMPDGTSATEIMSDSG